MDKLKAADEQLIRAYSLGWTHCQMNESYKNQEEILQLIKRKGTLPYKLVKPTCPPSYNCKN